MARSVLDIVKQAVRGKGINAPTSLLTGDDFSNQMLALCEEVAADMLRRVDWQALTMEGTFTTASGETQVNLKTQFPYLRKFIDGTVYNRTQQWPMRKVSKQAWQSMKASGVGAVSNIYRVRGDVFLTPSTQAAGETIAFEYIDKRIFSSSDGSVLREHITSDSDITRVDEDVLIAGVRWKFLQSKGFEYGEEYRLYEDAIAERAGADTPAEIISLNGGCSDEDYYGPSISEGSW